MVPGMRRALLTLALGIGVAAPAARACELALVLAVDVSGSVSPEEYRIQMDGLAAGLRDGVVTDALVAAKAEVMLVQWTGSNRQDTSIPWQSIASPEDVVALAHRIETVPRVWKNYSTAIGEALEYSMSAFTLTTACRRRVIDVSGDGRSNEGLLPEVMHADLRRAGITVNALVIETDDTDLTGYFQRHVIVGAGAFVMTANGFEEYPDRIRKKLVRETGKKLALNTRK